MERAASRSLAAREALLALLQEIFVSWAGFKGNVQRELAPSFFRVRLWSQKELLEQLFGSCDRLDEELRAELPLKRVWMLAAEAGE